MRTIVEMVRMECNDPESIINKVDTKEKTIRKKLRVYFDNCDGALKDVDKALGRYQKMNAFQKGKWALFGKEDIEGLKSNLSSFGTQLDSYVNNLTRQGVALANKNVEIGLGMLEELLEKNNGDRQATVGEAMLCRSGRSTKPSDEAHYRQVITDYVEETKIIEITPRRNRPSTPPIQQDGTWKPNTLDVKGHKPRAHSTGDAGEPRKPSSSPGKSPPKKKYTLECWLLQVRTTDVGLFTTRRMDKERMVRGQWKLEQMASQFKSSKEAKLANSDHLVRWVLEDRKKEETNTRYTWHPHAAKIEDKGSTYLGMKVEHQAMVIIRRQLTPEAQKKVDEKEQAEQKKREAQQKKQELEKKLEEIKQKKEETARRKAYAEQKRKERELKQEKEEAQERKAQAEKKKAKEVAQKEEQDQKKAEAAQKQQEEADRKQLAQEIKNQQRKDKAMQIKKDLEEKANKDTNEKADPEGEEKQSLEQANKGETRNCWHGDACVYPKCPFKHPHGICWHSVCHYAACPYRHMKGQKTSESMKPG